MAPFTTKSPLLATGEEGAQVGRITGRTFPERNGAVVAYTVIVRRVSPANLLAPVVALGLLGAACAGPAGPACAGPGACAALLLTAPQVGAVTLDQLEVVVRGAAARRHVRVRDRVLALPAQVAVELPEMDAAARRVTLYLRATYDAPGHPALDLSGSLDLTVGDDLQTPRQVALQPACAGLPCPSPGERQGAAMAYDPQSRHLVLFGGQRQDGALLDDTWEWDGAAWLPVPASARPGARAGHALSYDPQRGRLLLFGGGGAAGLLGDSWEYLGAGAGWQQAGAAGPPGPAPRRLAALATVAGEVVLFGGEGAGGALLGDTWRRQDGRWDFLADEGAGPLPRSGAALGLVRWPGGLTEALLIGGYAGRSAAGGERYDDRVWAWDGRAWHAALVEAPPTVLRRHGHKLVPAEQGNDMALLVTGGQTDDVVRQDAFLLDLHSRIFRPQLGMAPAARSGAAVAFDEERGDVVLLGGRGDGGNLGDTWIFQQEEGWSARPR